MPQVQVYNTQGDKVGEISLSPDLFGKEPNKGLLRAAVLAHLNNSRVGTVAVKTRAEVSGGGRKPWRQKGLGRARQGSIRSPLWRHGGVAFGPVARDYGWDLPKKVKKLALISALSAKARAEKVIVLKELKMDVPKTRDLYAMLKKFGAEKSSLIITGEHEPNVVLSARNIPGVKVTTARELNAYDAMAKRYLFVTEDALKKLEEVLS
ncbi:MAG TPA: 50S ribosomal protein L4 [Firmicutes bacterium]|nr:50S ribosomal protein L4 [Candidatus Fermentithermobacillaceae bacterium]